MIRSAVLTLKFANVGKKNILNDFLIEYRRVVSYFIDMLWEQQRVACLLPKDVTTTANTWLSARMRQCAAKQASSIVRGTRQKQKQRLYRYADFIKRGMFKKARKLMALIKTTKITKPHIELLQPQLDSRFVRIAWSTKTSFDGWITLSSLGKRLSICLPIKKHKHFKTLCARGTLRPGLRLAATKVTFAFEIQEPSKRNNGDVLGIDVGVKKGFCASNGVCAQADRHGWTLSAIMDRLARRKKGSKSFHKAQAHRENHINWSINQLNLNGVKAVRVERINNLRLGKRTSRKLNRWTYTVIFDKLKRLCEDIGVQYLQDNPAFTSQRCSACGWVQRTNRKGALFKCKSCGHTEDADLNAARNIGSNLRPLGANWRSLDNKTGFYWPLINQELIVPGAQQTDTCLYYP